MKRVVYNGLLLGALCVASVGLTLLSLPSDTEAKIETASQQYGSGNRRPFSFYYPYSYQYYYPRPHYQGRANACYWLYTNGSYVYYCN